MSFDEKNQIVILKDTTYDDVFALVEFMYRGEINVAQVSTHFFSWYLFFFFLNCEIFIQMRERSSCFKDMTFLFCLRQIYFVPK